jgi:hypothetical protein
MDYKFQKRIETLFKGENLIQYRECRESAFVEFWVTSDSVPGPYLTLAQLQKLSKLLKTEAIMFTGGDLGSSGCSRCATEEPAVYVLAEGVKFR